VHRFPFVCVSIALAVKKEVRLQYSAQTPSNKLLGKRSCVVHGSQEQPRACWGQRRSRCKLTQARKECMLRGRLLLGPHVQLWQQLYWKRSGTAPHSLRAQVTVGVVYNPVLRELFTAVAGRGARLNGAPIRVSGAAELGAALLVTEVGVARDDATVGAIFGRVGALTKQARRWSKF